MLWRKYVAREAFHKTRVHRGPSDSRQPRELPNDKAQWPAVLPLRKYVGLKLVHKQLNLQPIGSGRPQELPTPEAQKPTPLATNGLGQSQGNGTRKPVILRSRRTSVKDRKLGFGKTEGPQLSGVRRPLHLRVSQSGQHKKQSEPTDAKHILLEVDGRQSLKPSFKRLSIRGNKLPSKKNIFALLSDVQNDLSIAEAENAENGNDGISKHSKRLPALEQLPLSPLMHPRLIRARRRYMEAKPLPSRELNEFQTHINANPYAQILASPIRTCILTEVRLPVSFLTPFTLRRDPRTGRLWQIPTGFDDVTEQPQLTRNPSDTSLDPSSELMRSVYHRQCPSDAPDTPTLTELDSPTPIVELPPARAMSPPNPPSIPPTLPKSYVFAQHDFLAHISTLPRSLFLRTVPFRWKVSMGDACRTIIWREDMPDLVLSLLRKRAVNFLLDLASYERGFLVHHADSSSYKQATKDMVAVLLLHTSSRDEKKDGEGEAQDGSGQSPGTELRRGGELVPVFDLVVLLGGEGVNELEALRQKFGSENLGVKRGKISARVLVVLWILMRYLRAKDRVVKEWVER